MLVFGRTLLDQALRMHPAGPNLTLPPHDLALPTQVEMDDGNGFRHVARSTGERQCTVQGLRSGILYK